MVSETPIFSQWQYSSFYNGHEQKFDNLTTGIMTMDVFKIRLPFDRDTPTTVKNVVWR